MTTLTLRNARLADGSPVDIAIGAGQITAITPTAPDPVPPVAGEVLDARGMTAVPGLVNGHTHAAMTLLRGHGDDLPLKTWLEDRIWPAEARLSGSDIHWATRLACLEMIRSGTVCFADLYWQFHDVAGAVERMGLRAFVGAPLLDVAGTELGDRLQRETVQFHEESGRYSPLIRFHHTPHSIYGVGEQRLRWLADYSTRHGTLVHIHLAEMADEVTRCLAEQGVRPAFYLDRLGLLHPRVILAHGVHLNEAELDLIAERGATLVTNPASNMKLAVGGPCPCREVQRRGIPLALGTDGPASNNSLDLFQEMKIFSLLHKHATGDPTLLPAREVWQVATGAGAPIFGQRGVLAPGAAADLLLLDLNVPETTPNHNLLSNLVYAGTGHLVNTTIVAGRILMHDRKIPDEAEIRAEVERRSRALFPS